jgi:cytochrome c-type biogenesis protein CcmH/NrfG
MISAARPTTPSSIGVHGDNGRGGNGPGDHNVHRPTWLAIVGLFILISAAVLLVSWPGYRLAHHTRGAVSALADERWDDAIPHLEAITAGNPNAWFRRRQLGACFLALGQPREALDAYEASLQVNPEQDLRASIGRAIYMLDPLDPRGPRFLAAALADQPSDAETNFYIALYYKDLGRYREAATHLLGASAEPKWLRLARPHVDEIRARVIEE